MIVITNIYIYISYKLDGKDKATFPITSDNLNINYVQEDSLQRVFGLLVILDEIVTQICINNEQDGYFFENYTDVLMYDAGVIKLNDQFNNISNTEYKLEIHECILYNIPFLMYSITHNKS